MKLYRIGRVADTTSMKNTIILEANYEGHIVHVANPADFEVGKVMKLFIYEKSREDNQVQLFGFKTIDEWDQFTELVGNGQDCWKAMKQLANTKPSSKLHQPEEARSPLNTLGFRKNEIDWAIVELKPSDSIEELVEEAIRKISNKAYDKAQEGARDNSTPSKGRSK